MQCQCIRGYFYNEMHYINLRFTYLLTYLISHNAISNVKYIIYRCRQRMLRA